MSGKGDRFSAPGNLGSASRYAGRCVSSLGAHDGSGPDFALVWKRAAQNAYERGTGCIRLSVVTSLIPRR
jgi:hypothetical protein